MYSEDQFKYMSKIILCTFKFEKCQFPKNARMNDYFVHDFLESANLDLLRG